MPSPLPAATATCSLLFLLKFTQVDAFATKAFEGNPAAVCFLGSSLPEIDDKVLQAIAAENNLSETAFVQPLAPENSSANEFKDCNRFKLRWFTPEIEVPLCGHATLASAAALFECAGNTSETLFFETKSGELAVQRVAAAEGNKDSLKIAMDLPLIDAVPVESISKEFAENAWVVAKAANFTDPRSISEIHYAPSLRYLVIVYQDNMTRQLFESINPDIKAMQAAHTDGKLVGVIITAGDATPMKDNPDFNSRFFGPWAGIDEDPVTGSAHSILGPYWSDNLGKTELKARQCSKRGGDLDVRVDREAGRVVVSGGAVVVIRGELSLDV
jgi:PhzF family phenazine biosynthesis protein